MNLFGLLASAIVSFAAAYAFIPWLIRSLRGTSLVGKDLHKREKPLIPEMGGVAVILGFYVGVAVIAFGASQDTSSSLFFAALSACLGAGVIGLVDDMFHLRKRSKAVLPFVMALPLGAAVYASGNRLLLGTDIGLLMVVAVPLGVTSAANAANMLEGFNGLGAGLGIVMTFGLVVLSLLTGADKGLFLLFPLLGALVAFLWFNRYPARIFPGDSMTLFAGATLASAAIISSPSLKTFGAILFVPMIVEFLLKARGRFRAENYGILQADGRILYQGRIESLTHLITRSGLFREWQIVAILWGIESVFVFGLLVATLLRPA